jgi:type VII secretion protein EccB
MQTQRDHVHAHQFQMARMSSALMLGDPSMAENPMRRTSLGLVAGVVISLLAVVAFGVYGWIVPGGKTSWRKAGAIIVEKETGTRYVFLNGTLYPTLNMASAMIITGGTSAKVELVSRNSLKGVPHGNPIGIPGAPQVLPAQPADVVRGPWLVCLGGSLGPAAAGQVGLNLDPSAPAAELTAERFMLVDGGREQFLLWRGNKHRIADDSIPVALGVANAVPVPAPESWLAMLPSGDDLAVPSIPGRGKNGVGELITQATSNGDEQLFVRRQDGLAPVNRTMFQLLQAGTGTTPEALDAAAVAAEPRSADRSLIEPFAELAAARPDDGKGRVLCQQQKPADAERILIRLVLTTPDQAGVTADGTRAVRLRPGSGMVVYPVPKPKTSQPDPYLIADQGLRYHLPDRQAMTSLKLAPDQQVPFPRSLLEDIPQGPALARTTIVTEREG